MNHDEIRKAVKKWSKVRTSPEKVVKFLNQGCCFKIERAQYDVWKKFSPLTINAYVGIFESKLKMVFVDNVSDKDLNAETDSAFVKDYLDGLNISKERFIENATDGNIKVIDALKRSMQWNIFMKSWVYSVVDSEYGIFQGFRIPFEDFVLQFEGTMALESIALFGITPENKAELVFWVAESIGSNKTKLISLDGGENPVENFTYPVPPFH